MRAGLVERAAKAALRAVCRRRGHQWERVDGHTVDGHRLVARCRRCPTTTWAV